MSQLCCPGTVRIHAIESPGHHLHFSQWWLCGKVPIENQCSVLFLKEMVEVVQAQAMSAGGMQKALAS